MLTTVVENPEVTSNKIFNCVSDRTVTLDGMAKLCTQAAVLSVEIVYYDLKAVGVDAKKTFPFRKEIEKIRERRRMEGFTLKGVLTISLRVFLVKNITSYI
uniref:Uncharacterized protein n=1 Tax=Manihot esculenta TaxID=3983 RepID=A0A2C9UMQ8_MANES